MKRTLPVPIRWAAVRFGRRHRQAYYHYLADILQATQGHRTFRNVLAHDAHRYGPRTARGRLSAYWAHQIEEHGDVALAFSGTLPPGEVAMLATLQRMGGTALASGLRDLAAMLRLDMAIRDILLRTLSMGCFAMLVCLATMFAISAFTVPALLASFAQVDPAWYGAATRRLTAFAEWLDNWLWLLLVALAGASWSLRSILPGWNGRLRKLADGCLPGFSLYRDTQAISFLVSLAATLKPRAGQHYSMTEALTILHEHASPWLGEHIAQMALRLSDAQSGAALFRTGLLDAQTYWYLEDLVDAVGMDEALQKTRLRLEHDTLAAVARRALLTRWTLIGLALAFLVATMLWHYAVIHEMRAALLLAY